MDINQYIHRAADWTRGEGSITTLMGDAGVGKTTIAWVCWPSPVFIPIEQGLLSVPEAAAVQAPKTTTEILAFLDMIKAGKESGSFAYRSVILDSVSEMETMAVHEVCEQHGVQSLGDIKGYGTGYDAVGGVHRRVKEKCAELKTLGVHVVVIAHAVSKEDKFPDDEPYSRWVLQMGRKGSGQWLNQVDAVIHVKNHTQIVIKGSSKAKVATAIKDQRLLDMVAKPSTVAKNRFGITQDVILHYKPGDDSFVNPLAPIFKFDNP